MATRVQGLDDAAASLVREIARPERRAMRRRVVSAIAIMAMVILIWSGSKSPKVEESKVPRLTGVKAFHAACRATPHREVCIQTLMPKYRAHAAIPQGLTAILIATAAQGVAKTLSAVLANRGGNTIGFAGERVCHSTLVTSIELLETTLAAWNESSDRAPFEDIQMRLRAATEFHSTCIDALAATGALEAHTVEAKQHAEKLLRNAASFVAAFGQFGPNLHTWEGPTHLDENGPNSGRTFLDSDDALPSWMTRSQRAELLTTDPLIDVVVAKDGSGQFKSIQGAIDWAPPKSTGKRYVIGIKAGVYKGQVIIPKTATNFMFLGDGAASTIISGNRSASATPGMTTFFSPSLIVEGAGFIGKGFTVRNTAAANVNAERRGLPQAVAMRVAADRAAFDQCVFDGGQDTLHTHTFRQFYRNSTIAGTAERFILGNGAIASFQSCTMVPKNQQTDKFANVHASS